MKNKILIIVVVVVILAAGIGTAIYFHNKKKQGEQNEMTVAEKRQALIDLVSYENDPLVTGAFLQMTTDEIKAAYTFEFDYLKKRKPVPPGSDLEKAINAISVKYNLYT